MAKVINLADYKEAKARGLTADDVMTLWDEASEVPERAWLDDPVALTPWLSAPSSTMFRQGLTLRNDAAAISFPGDGPWIMTRLAGRIVAASKTHGVWVLVINDAQQVHSWTKVQFPD